MGILQSRITPWAIVWAALLLVCLVAAIALRASYTDFTKDQEALMALRYSGSRFFAEMAHSTEEIPGGTFLDAEQVADGAEVIVECEFQGKREYVYQAFLSEVEVVRVLKGGEGLEGQVISVFEPARIAGIDPGTWFPETQDEWKGELSKHFGYQEGKPFYQVEPNGAYLYGGTMMAESGRYVLFLAKKAYSPYDDRTGKAQEYVLVNSPFAKLRIDSSKVSEGLDLPQEHISLKESLAYEVLAADREALTAYWESKEEILRSLKD
ncbi:MAG: hypothetical protein LBG81_09630 [Coriobacteriaceae bacterium]|jgi:hypothetical protein|nr:hypothetical protein [Coriobacteriaceae bacterium]